MFLNSGYFVDESSDKSFFVTWIFDIKWVFIKSDSDNRLC